MGRFWDLICRARCFGFCAQFVTRESYRSPLFLKGVLCCVGSLTFCDLSIILANVVRELLILRGFCAMRAQIAMLVQGRVVYVVIPADSWV